MSARDAHEDDGEGYFASISDLMVGILFVFLMMLTVFALNLRDSEDVSRRKFDEKVAQLEADIARHQRILSDGGLYARDPKKFRSVSETLAAAQSELSAAEERWLELETLREQVEGP